MEWLSNNGILYGTYSLFSEHRNKLFHGVFTRQGGVSRDPFASLNAGFHVGDEEACVNKNQKKIAKVANSILMSPRQVHGTHVHIVKKSMEDISKVEADSIITNIPGISLMILTADCQAILLYDPIKKVIANVHAGWRGSIQNILEKTMVILKNQFDCIPETIFAAIGPSLGPCCAEFKHYKTEIPKKFWTYQYKENYFDFWKISQDQLINMGIKPEHTEIAGFCTVCYPELFYSYRAKQITGRFATVIGILE